MTSAPDVSVGGSIFVRGQRVSENIMPEKLAQLEEEERKKDGATRESEAQKSAMEARIE